MVLTAEAQALTGDEAWLQAMLDVEAALAAAQASVGMIPDRAAAGIRAVCRAELFDPRAIGEQAVLAGNPAIPLVAALRGAVDGDTAEFVHFGATSQDIVDSAAMLVAASALDAALGGLREVAASCARLADQHRSTVMAARTLLQQAVPTTFGLVAAGWLNGVVDAHTVLAAVRKERLALQLGGAGGTLASFGTDGLLLVSHIAAALGLAEPSMSWHTSRGRLIEIAGALALAVSATEKIALDVLMLSQSEIGELAEAPAAGKGQSSAMPQKRNAVGAVNVRAAAIQARGSIATLVAQQPHEFQRAAGAWQAEWIPLSEALALTVSVVQRCRDLASGLRVDSARMRSNMDLTGGLIMAEAMARRLGELLGRATAQEVVRACAMEVSETARSFADVLSENAIVTRNLGASEIRSALEPMSYLGSTNALIDRALNALSARMGAGEEPR